MQSELEKATAEIDEATRCMGDGLDEQAADHLAAAAALLETLIHKSPSPAKPATSDRTLLRRPAAA